MQNKVQVHPGNRIDKSLTSAASSGSQKSNDGVALDIAEGEGTWSYRSFYIKKDNFYHSDEKVLIFRSTNLEE